MSKFKDVNWDLPTENSRLKGWEFVDTALLMDIRDELKQIRQALQPLRHLDCHNFLRIPNKLDRIGRNTEHKKKAIKS